MGSSWMLDRCLIFHGHCGFQIAPRWSPIQSFLDSFTTNNSLGFVLIESIKKKEKSELLPKTECIFWPLSAFSFHQIWICRLKMAPLTWIVLYVRMTAQFQVVLKAVLTAISSVLYFLTDPNISTAKQSLSRGRVSQKVNIHMSCWAGNIEENVTMFEIQSLCFVTHKPRK